MYIRVCIHRYTYTDVHLCIYVQVSLSLSLSLSKGSSILVKDFGAPETCIESQLPATVRRRSQHGKTETASDRSNRRFTRHSDSVAGDISLHEVPQAELLKRHMVQSSELSEGWAWTCLRVFRECSTAPLHGETLAIMTCQETRAGPRSAAVRVSAPF